MIEFDSAPLSGTGSPFHVKIRDNGMYEVTGGFQMEFPHSLLERILEEVFSDSNWKMLGAYRNNPTNIGKFMRDQRISPAYQSPQYASAIAPIMVHLNLLEAKPFKSKREGIWLRRS
jgi:hypothetical protein